jgi:hypothetical protein
MKNIFVITGKSKKKNNNGAILSSTYPIFFLIVFHSFFLNLFFILIVLFCFVLFCFVLFVCCLCLQGTSSAAFDLAAISASIGQLPIHTQLGLARMFLSDPDSFVDIETAPLEAMEATGDVPVVDNSIVQKESSLVSEPAQIASTVKPSEVSMTSTASQTASSQGRSTITPMAAISIPSSAPTKTATAPKPVPSPTPSQATANSQPPKPAIDNDDDLDSLLQGPTATEAKTIKSTQPPSKPSPAQHDSDDDELDRLLQDSFR